MKRILRKVTQKENKINSLNKFKSLWRKTQNAMIVTASRTGVTLPFRETKTNRRSRFKPNQTFPASSWTRKSLMWFLRTLKIISKPTGLAPTLTHYPIIVPIWAKPGIPNLFLRHWIRSKTNRSSLNPAWMLAATMIKQRCARSRQSQRPDWRVARTPWNKFITQSDSRLRISSYQSGHVEVE